MTVEAVIQTLKSHTNAANIAGMQRFGIDTTNALGISIPVLRAMAKDIKKDHVLAAELWDTGFHEARILASMIADPKLVTKAQMDSWTEDFNSWDVCDQVCGNLFDRTTFAIEKAFEYTTRHQEFVKRAGFVLMAGLTVHHKKLNNDVFISFLPVIEREAHDDRNFVKKAVNWALRQIGKRNKLLNQLAIAAADNIALQNTRPARWIAANALTELQSDKVQARLTAAKKTG